MFSELKSLNDFFSKMNEMLFAKYTTMMKDLTVDKGRKYKISILWKPIQISKSGKAICPYKISLEIMTLLDCNVIESLTALLNVICILLPKITKAKRCNEVITLMSHVFKIMSCIIDNRIYDKCEHCITEIM